MLEDFWTIILLSNDNSIKPYVTHLISPLDLGQIQGLFERSLEEFNTFVGHVGTKLKRDAQRQSKKVQDWAAYMEHLLFILLEFSANNTPGEGQLGHIFYNSLRRSIKFWIVDIENEMPWDNFVSIANKIEAKAKIHGNTYLDLWCPKGKQLWKLVSILKTTRLIRKLLLHRLKIKPISIRLNKELSLKKTRLRKPKKKKRRRIV